MRCFARWERDDKAGLFFRDQTILQFGNSWDLLASFILLNPGSSLPLGEEPKTDFLRAKKLPFFVEPRAQEKYVEFSIDRLMRDKATYRRTTGNKHNVLKRNSRSTLQNRA